ncbi:acyl-CoA carboxylase subunit beta, partial [Pseudomonas aeruginosa]
RKAYGAGLYAMAGPAFEPDACIALTTAQIAVMGPEAAINAVYANKIAALPESERPAFIAQKTEEYREEIDVYRLASELVVDDVIEPNELRQALVERLEVYKTKKLTFTERKH